MTSSLTTNSHTSTNGDLEYCKELARKSVARAALHLGMESMSGDSLDVMGDALVTYLDKVGRVLATSVQSSSRTSAHCNVLDAIHAVEVCTAPAANQVFLGDNINNNNNSINVNINTADNSWKGLASFLYGPKWMEEPQQPTTTNPNNTNTNTPAPKGGKQLPSHPPTITTTTTTTTTNNTNSVGWNAPFMDTVNYFPATKSLFPKQMTQSFHTYAVTNAKDAYFNNSQQSQQQHQQSNQQPDDNDIFLSDGIDHFWGIDSKTNKDSSSSSSLEHSSTSQQPQPPQQQQPQQQPPNNKEDEEHGTKNNKKQKINHNTNNEKQGSTADYVPNFLPPFPPQQTYDLKQHVVLQGVGMSNVLSLQNKKDDHDDPKNNKQNATTGIATKDQQEQQQIQRDEELFNFITTNNPYVVRSSLVKLEDQYWGAIVSDDHTNTNTKHTDTPVSVPAGRHMDNAKNASASTSNNNNNTGVIPLHRMSSSRVGRILEGSMDPSFP